MPNENGGGSHEGPPSVRYLTSNDQKIWSLMLEMAAHLEDQLTGDAIAASILLAFVAVTDKPPSEIPHAKLKALVEQVSEFLSVWDLPHQ